MVESLWNWQKDEKKMCRKICGDLERCHIRMFEFWKKNNIVFDEFSRFVFFHSLYQRHYYYGIREYFMLMMVMTMIQFNYNNYYHVYSYRWIYLLVTWFGSNAFCFYYSNFTKWMRMVAMSVFHFLEIDIHSRIHGIF